MMIFAQAFFRGGEGFATISARANQGDAEAQWVVSQIYEYCFSYSLSPQKALNQYDALEKIYPAAKRREVHNAFVGIKSQLAKRCPQVDNGAPIPAEAITMWLEQSAKNGFLVARIRSESLKESHDESALLALVGDIRGQPPRVVFEMGAMAPLIEKYWKDPSTAAAFSAGSYSQFAWQIAACRAGLDCSASSTVMYWACQQGGCGYESYEQYVMSEIIPPGGKAQLESTIKIIQQNFM